jgi:hypothetical protein
MLERVLGEERKLDADEPAVLNPYKVKAMNGNSILKMET